MRMKASRYCCGAPVDNASYISAATEMITGAIIFSGVLYFRGTMCVTKMEEVCYTFNNQPKLTKNMSREERQRKIDDFEYSEHVFYCIVIVCLSCSGVQAIMGIVLCMAVKMQSRCICLMWIVTAALTCFFTAFLIRIFNILVVYEFYRELGVLQRLKGLPKGPSRSLPVPTLIVTRPSKPQILSDVYF